MGNRVIPANDQIHADAVPDPSDQEVAELSVNAVTGNLYVKRVDGSIHSLQDKFNEFAERVETEIGNIEHSIDCVRMGADGEVGLVSRHGVVLIESGAYRDRNKDIHKGTVVFQSLSYDSNTGNPNPCRVESYGYGVRQLAFSRTSKMVATSRCRLKRIRLQLASVQQMAWRFLVLSTTAVLLHLH